MILHVPFKEFPITVQRILGHNEVFLENEPHGTLATAAHPTSERMVAAQTDLSVAEAKDELEKAGMQVATGNWGDEIEFRRLPGESSRVYIGAVAYVAAERPGLWIDAFPEAPSQLQVLRGLYDEFTATGEISGVVFEEFVRIANPNVVIVTPKELDRHVGAKLAKPS